MGFFKHSFRAPHLGKYPMERLKRVARPTTRIDDDKVPRVPLRGAFFTRPMFGDLGEKTKKQRARFINKYPLADAMGEVMMHNIEKQHGEVAEEKAPIPDDLVERANHIKSLCYFLDIDIVGICKVPDYAWYSHDGNGDPVTTKHKYAIVMLIDQGYETMEGASGDDWISGVQSYRAYLKGQTTGNVVAGYLRKLGYDARSHSAPSGQVLQLPLMLWAGLGEMARIGELVLNPFIGPRSKTAVVTTDLEMAIDQPIDFGLQKLCQTCDKCARECPTYSIPFGDKIMFNGYETWKPDVESCAKYRINNQKGSACGRCMKTCPVNKVFGPEGPWALRAINRVVNWFPVLKRFVHPFLVRVDDWLGYGKRVPGQKWWWDLETVDGHVVKAKSGSNERDIDPSRGEPKNHCIALYPAEDNPPGDSKEAHKPDRKKALEKGANPERP